MAEFRRLLGATIRASSSTSIVVKRSAWPTSHPPARPNLRASKFSYPGSNRKIIEIEVQPLPFGEEEPSDLLYHYTTLEGLIGIISGKSIRATHVRYLNDISEIRNAFSAENIEALIGELCPGLDAPTVKNLRALMVPNEDRYDAFIVSFTDDAAAPETNQRQIGDRLSQWRGYPPSHPSSNVSA